MRILRDAVCLLVLPLALACAGAHDPPGMQQAGVTGPTTGLHVSVALSSAHLGAEGCTHDESGGLRTMSCVAPSDAGPRGTGLCGGPCDFSSVQLAFASGSSGTAAHVQITQVALLDAATGMDLQALTAYTPLVWNGTQYDPWDETVAPSSQIKASYTLSPPAWSTFDASFSYSRQYKVRITIVIDGMAVTLESPALTRPPILAT
jgi:hypothetical protein